jgi:hypothetical protein
MNDAIQVRIMNALLDKYERSTFFRDEKQPTRRIMLHFYNGGRSDFPYYDIEKSERRISVNRAVIALSNRNLISFDWMRGEREHIIAKVWLHMDHLSSAYQLAEREPKGDAVEKICLEIAGLKSRVRSEWACDFLQNVYDELTRRRSIVSTIPADQEERELLLRAISAVDTVDGAEYTERVFSLRTFGDSKIFERFVRSRLLSILRKYLDSDDDVTDEDLLKQVGIVKYPEQFEFCGRLSVIFTSGNVNFCHLQSGGIIHSSDLASGRIVIDPSVACVITIENRANYIEYVRRRKTEKALSASLIVYHGGQYSPRKRIFLQTVAAALPENCKWYHWSDIDYGGFTMLSRIRQEIMPSALPYRMDAGELARYRNFAVTIKAPYAESLKKLRIRSELSDCRDCIDYMLKHMIRLEQEAMLTDS